MKITAIRKHLTRAGLEHLFNLPGSQPEAYQYTGQLPQMIHSHGYCTAGTGRAYVANRVHRTHEQLTDAYERGFVCVRCNYDPHLSVMGPNWRYFAFLAKLLSALRAAEEALAQPLGDDTSWLPRMRKHLVNIQRHRAELRGTDLECEETAQVAIQQTMDAADPILERLEELLTGPAARAIATAWTEAEMKEWESRSPAPTLAVLWSSIPETLRMRTDAFKIRLHAPVDQGPGWIGWEKATVLLGRRYVITQLLGQCNLVSVAGESPSVLELNGDEDIIREALRAAGTPRAAIEVAQQYRAA